MFGWDPPPPRVPLLSLPKAGRKIFEGKILLAPKAPKQNFGRQPQTLEGEEGGGGGAGRGVPPLLLRCTAVLINPLPPPHVLARENAVGSARGTTRRLTTAVRSRPAAVGQDASPDPRRQWDAAGRSTARAPGAKETAGHRQREGTGGTTASGKRAEVA